MSMATEDSHIRSDEDVEAILRLAVQQSATDSASLRERMRATANELGITDAQLAAAEEAYRREMERQTEAAAEAELEAADWKLFRKTQVHDFFQHFGTYIAVNAFLAFIDFRDGGFGWFYWPLMGWGIGIAIHLASVLAAYSDENQTEFQKWRKKRRKRSKSLD